MKKHIFDETNGLWYTLNGDYYLPDLETPDEEKAQYGKFGRVRLRYLEEEKESYYIMLMMQGQLNQHLNQIDREANDKMDLLVDEMAERQSVTEQLKKHDQMRWVGMMNNIRSAAEEIVLHEFIFV